MNGKLGSGVLWGVIGAHGEPSRQLEERLQGTCRSGEMWGLWELWGNTCGPRGHVGYMGRVLGVLMVGCGHREVLWGAWKRVRGASGLWALLNGGPHQDGGLTHKKTHRKMTE